MVPLGGPAKKIDDKYASTFKVNFLSNGFEFLNFDCRFVLRRLKLIRWKVNAIEMLKKVVPLGGPAKKLTSRPHLPSQSIFSATAASF